jgi:hypothetical protein
MIGGGGFKDEVQHGLTASSYAPARPFLGNVVQRQIKQFQQCLVTRERPTVLRDFAQTYVHRLYGIGRVDDAPHFWRVCVQTP